MFILLGSAIIFVAAGAVSAQGIGDRNRPRGRGNHLIVGKVYMPDGSPAKGIKVVASGADNPDESTRTNNDGEYTISGLPGGNYSVTVREPGFKADTEVFNISEGVTGGQSFHATFYLKPTGDSALTNPLLAGVSKDAIAKFQKGMEKVSNDPKAAIIIFDEAIAAYPNFAAAHFERGAALLKANDQDRALEAFVKAIQIKPDYVEAKYSYGYTEYLKKNYVVAAAVFDDVLKQKSDMPEAQMYLGISLYYLKNVDAAESHLKLAASSTAGEKVALAHRFLGGIYMQKKQKAPAAAELQKYIDLVPKAPDADKLRATIADLKKQG